MVENCIHGVTFDQKEADRILRETKEEPHTDPTVAFIMGPVNATAIIRKRWPRRGSFTKEAPCPFCGYVGIAYASAEHYAYGDW